MFKAILRAIGYLVTGLAIAVFFVDGVRSISREMLVLTPLENFWRLVEPASLLATRRWIDGLDGLGSMLIEGFQLPAGLWLLAVGALFALLGRKRRLIAPEARTK